MSEFMNYSLLKSGAEHAGSILNQPQQCIGREDVEFFFSFDKRGDVFFDLGKS